jgi:hypothetical protein
MAAMYFGLIWFLLLAMKFSHVVPSWTQTAEAR